MSAPRFTFPSNPLNAAILYFGVLAYPEADAGRDGGPGGKFVDALQDYTLWCAREQHGLRALRERLEAPHLFPPQRRQFDAKLDRGLKRIWRRIAAYELYRRRTSQAARLAVDRDGRTTYESLRRATPSIEGILGADLEGWSRRLGLNRTGVAASAEDKVHDLQRRAVRPSTPVLHMAHGLFLSSEIAYAQVPDVKTRDPLLILILNPDRWVWQAIDLAEKWRVSRGPPGRFPNLDPAEMLTLNIEKLPNNALVT